MAPIHTADSIASILRSSPSGSALLTEADIHLLSCLFAFCGGNQIKSATAPAPKVHRETILDEVVACQRNLGLSKEGSALELPSLLDSKLGILTWRTQLSVTTGGVVCLQNRIHLIVSDTPASSPWQNCARQLGRLLLRKPSAGFCHFERSRFDNSSEKRTVTGMEAQFSMYLLAPDSAFISALRSVRKVHSIDVGSPVGDIDLLWLSRIFGISFYVAGKRAEQLNLLPKGASAALTSLLMDEHGGPEARARYLGLPDRADAYFPNVSQSVAYLLAKQIALGEFDLLTAQTLFGPLLGSNQGVLH